MTRFTGRPLIIALVLALWVVAGPVAMAFDGCAMMGAMCEAPCGVLSYIVAPGVARPFVSDQVTYLQASQPGQVATATLTPLEPPPKSALLSA